MEETGSLVVLFIFLIFLALLLLVNSIYDFFKLIFLILLHASVFINLFLKNTLRSYFD